MICVSVFYPNTSGKKFDHKYYAEKHMPFVLDKAKSFGLLRYEIDTGLSGGATGSPAPYASIGRLYFTNVEEFEKGMEAHGAEFIADIPNYTDIQPQFQVSQMTPS
jgi:uncharacterized protein (TIGR02118 family)